MHNVRLQGSAKWKAELTLDAELYLKVQQVNRRRMDQVAWGLSGTACGDGKVGDDHGDG